jgi:hypothetical protein
MANVSVLEFAELLGATTCGGMAQGVGLEWPPPPAVSLRNVIQLAGLPLAPANLQLLSADGSLSKIDVNTAPVEVDLSWTDPGEGTPRRAMWYELTVTNRGTGEVWEGRSFTATPPFTLGVFPNTLALYAGYEWSVLSANNWGKGPTSRLDFSTTRPAPTDPRSIPAAPPTTAPPTVANGTLTLTLESDDLNFQFLGAVWTVWHQTGSGFDTPMNAYGQTGTVTLKATGQYQITALVTVLGETSGDTAEFSGDATGPDGSPTVVYVWNGGNVTKTFRVTSTTDGYGQPEALIVLVS